MLPCDTFTCDRPVQDERALESISVLCVVLVRVCGTQRCVCFFRCFFLFKLYQPASFVPFDGDLVYVLVENRLVIELMLPPPLLLSAEGERQHRLSPRVLSFSSQSVGVP